MKPTGRLTSKERRAAIIQAVRRLFAEKGFHGTTTRELAEAAKVSEALLFKHFPTKESLYEAMMLACKSESGQNIFERIQALEPSTSTLVLLVHGLTTHLVDEGCGDAIQNRLVFRSLLEDGEFARFVLQQIGKYWVTKVEECLQAARAAGDAVTTTTPPGLGAWLAHHLAVAVLQTHLPEPPAVNYGTKREQLVEQIVRFALRGMGLKEEAIQRDYNPAALALLEL
jgi:AcrR family transcriptional regulator